MAYDFVLKGGMLIDPQNGIHDRMDIAVEDGRIAAVSEDLSSNTIISVEGKTIIPGGIDPHVHCDSLLASRAGFYMVAKTGITTVVDFAGPPDEIMESVATGYAYGLNVAGLETVRTDPQEGQDLSRGTVEKQLDKALKAGALGLKLLGGHFPLTPTASRYAVDVANERKKMIAIHSGSTAQRSDILGMRESVYDLADGRPIVLAHINAYCRGNVKPYLQELEEAFTMLRENPNVYSDSHVATQNATYGKCNGAEVLDHISQNCLRSFGYAVSRNGIEQAITDGVVRVARKGEKETVLLEREEALKYYRSVQTDTMISFPANLSTTACCCLLEKRAPKEFLIQMAATDGGGIPRNDLLGRMIHFYRLGYLSLEDIVSKVCIMPAKVFGFRNKGHLGVGADADISVLDLERDKAVMSFARGNMIMKDGVCIGQGGCALVPEEANDTMKRLGCDYQIIDITRDSILYQH